MSKQSSQPKKVYGVRSKTTGAILFNYHRYGGIAKKAFWNSLREAEKAFNDDIQGVNKTDYRLGRVRTEPRYPDLELCELGTLLEDKGEPA